MDSVTQILLGAAVGGMVMGKQMGRKALLWGGAFGLFPDLDVLLPFGDAVKDFTYHRGASHSLFVLTVLTPFFVYLIRKIHPMAPVHRLRLFAAVHLILVTHALLDCLTVYGTQIFWPLPTPPVMWSTIFIIDPAYSIPMAVGVLTALLLAGRGTTAGWRINTVCFALSTLYLIWTVGVKLHVTKTARESLLQQSIGYERLLTVPSPFNTLLWRILVMDRQGYYEGFYSLLDSEKELQFHRYESRPELIENAMDLWQIRRLQWFTQGFYAVSKEGQNIVITDLRMGMEPFYIFRFAVAAVEEGRIEAIVSRRIPIQPRLEQIRWVWQRIWQQDMEPVFTSETPRDASVTSGSSLTPKAEARFSSST